MRKEALVQKSLILFITKIRNAFLLILEKKRPFFEFINHKTSKAAKTF